MLTPDLTRLSDTDKELIGYALDWARRNQDAFNAHYDLEHNDEEFRDLQELLDVTDELHAVARDKDNG
jgi:hypothetical protein